MENVPHDQTPMSSKLTTMLLYLRDDDLSKMVRASSEQDNEPEICDIESNGIILGGDVCNCRKSKCLKLYCQCFNAARICNDLCRCTSCSNTDSNQSGRSEAVKIILDRNPAAFDSKFLSHDPRAQAAAHKSGCKCRKSMCLKKYCECFEASVPCGSTCICVECGNTEIDRQRLAMKSSSSVLVVPSKAPRSHRSSNAKRASHQNFMSSCSQIDVPVVNPDMTEIGITDIMATHLTEGALTNLTVSQSVKSPLLLSSVKRNLQDIEHQTKPTLRIKKQRLPVVCKGGSPSDSNPAIPSGRSVVRPTMLSRVITIKNYNRPTKLIKQSANRVCPEKAICCKENVENSPIAMASIVIDPSSPDDEVKQRIRNHETSPFSTSAHSTCHMDRRKCRTGIEDIPSSGKNRFVSPNTASVASALSLLSRLPFLHR